MRTINIIFKTGEIIPLAVKDEYINNIVIDLYKNDVENKIETISVLPAERMYYHEKERCLQCYQ